MKWYEIDEKKLSPTSERGAEYIYISDRRTSEKSGELVEMVFENTTRIRVLIGGFCRILRHRLLSRNLERSFLGLAPGDHVRSGFVYDA